MLDRLCNMTYAFMAEGRDENELRKLDHDLNPKTIMGKIRSYEAKSRVKAEKPALPPDFARIMGAMSMPQGDK